MFILVRDGNWRLTFTDKSLLHVEGRDLSNLPILFSDKHFPILEITLFPF